ncbi:MAG: D-2-hydroxyacid dehydrogenase [Ilumatobacteraceae bacterium]
MGDVLFCTEAFLERHGDELRAMAPELGTVVLRGDERVDDEDLARITIAHFSSDAWPERAANFMAVAMGAPNLRWLHSMSAGVDHPVFQMFVDRGVRVTTSSGSSSQPIAATVLMYLLALARDLPRMMRAQAQREWAWERWTELRGRQVAILGMGPIGLEVARLAAEFGMEPTIVRRAVHGDEAWPTRTLAELTDVVAQHDAVVVALPLTDETRGIISADIIGAMRPGALFVNVGRGELVDQPELTAALGEGRLGGAGLDVTDPEPLPPDDPLWELPNVIITPHNSGSTDGTARRASEAFLANLDRWRTGEPLLNEIG